MFPPGDTHNSDRQSVAFMQHVHFLAPRTPYTYCICGRVHLPWESWNVALHYSKLIHCPAQFPNGSTNVAIRQKRSERERMNAGRKLHKGSRRLPSGKNPPGSSRHDAFCRRRYHKSPPDRTCQFPTMLRAVPLQETN